jgi:chromosome segregation ATPase
MTRRQNSQHRRYSVIAVFLAALSVPTLAQDIPGLEHCTAEKQMERRTGCLQSNDDYLQQQMVKLARETQAKMTASNRELAAAKAEIAALKTQIDTLSGELETMKAKVESSSKK